MNIELLKIAHENNIENNLITNGKCLTFEKIHELEKYLDYITFFVDSVDDNLNKEKYNVSTEEFDFSRVIYIFLFKQKKYIDLFKL